MVKQRSESGLSVAQWCEKNNLKTKCFYYRRRRSDRIKGVMFEGDGFLLLYKRLVPGFRFNWPRNEAEVKELTMEQYDFLMKGFNHLQKRLIKDIQPKRLA